MPARTIIKLSISYTSSLIPMIMVTTTPTTARHTPAANRVTVPTSVKPIQGRYLLGHVCVKKDLPLNIAQNPVATETSTPTAAITTQFNGNPLFTVSKLKDKYNKTKAEERSKAEINPPPG